MAKVRIVLPYCLRTDDERMFMRSGKALDDLAYGMRYGHVYGDKETTIRTTDAILCAGYLCALRDLLTMSRRQRDEWVRLNREALDLDKKGGG